MKKILIAFGAVILTVVGVFSAMTFAANPKIITTENPSVETVEFYTEAPKTKTSDTETTKTQATKTDAIKTDTKKTEPSSNQLQNTNNAPPRLIPEYSVQERAISSIDGEFQTVRTDLGVYSFTPIVVQTGVPVRWTITVSSSDLNSCNNAIIIPEFGIQKDLVVGDNLIEFTPVNSGAYRYSCWMGMINSTIGVVDDIENFDPDALTALENEIAPAGGCCGAGGMMGW